LAKKKVGGLFYQAAHSEAPVGFEPTRKGFADEKFLYSWGVCYFLKAIDRILPCLGFKLVSVCNLALALCLRQIREVFLAAGVTPHILGLMPVFFASAPQIWG